MIQENEIYYDKKLHRAYVAKIVGSEFAFLRFVLFGDIEGKGCFISQKGVTNKDRVIVKDLCLLHKRSDEGHIIHDSSIFKIGYMEPGRCGKAFFQQDLLYMIQNFRKQDNWVNEEDNDVIVKTANAAITKEMPAVVKATTKKATPKVGAKKVAPRKTAPKKVIKKSIKKPNKK